MTVKDGFNVPLNNCCPVCGGFVELKKGDFVAAHSVQECPLTVLPDSEDAEDGIAQLISILNHISERLSDCEIQEIIVEPTLQRLALRKALIEQHLHRLNIALIYYGPRIIYFEYSKPVVDELLNNDTAAQNAGDSITQSQNQNGLDDFLWDDAQVLQYIQSSAENQIQSDQQSVQGNSNNSKSLKRKLQEMVGSDDEYQIFKSNLNTQKSTIIDKAVQNNILTVVDIIDNGNDNSNNVDNDDDDDSDNDSLFPENRVSKTREPGDEYRDDDEVQVTKDELLDLFELSAEVAEDEAGDSSGNSQSNEEEVQYNASARIQLFDQEMLCQFQQSLSENIQIVLQSLAVSKEFQLLNLQNFNHWKLQLAGFIDLVRLGMNDTQSTSTMLDQVHLLKNQLPLLVKTIKDIEHAPISADFNKGLLQNWNIMGQAASLNRKKRTYIPFPNSLQILLMNLGLHFDGKLIPDWTVKEKPAGFRVVEDELLIMSLYEYGQNYNMIREQHLPHKSNQAIINRLKNQSAKRVGGNTLIKQYYFSSRKPFLDKEQQLLRSGIQKYGTDFHRIQSRFLPHRYVGELRRAYAVLHERWNPPEHSCVVLQSAENLHLTQQTDHGSIDVLFIHDDEDSAGAN
ncbi:hypothetical protein MP228_008549 [Amoeboaphelidium protococcarum]|nr:hypothetical protein MP228_008549 [Amoeboaphelidium protococcarum]